jgi:hypothetical protein
MASFFQRFRRKSEDEDKPPRPLPAPPVRPSNAPRSAPPPPSASKRPGEAPNRRPASPRPAGATPARPPKGRPSGPAPRGVPAPPPPPGTVAPNLKEPPLVGSGLAPPVAAPSQELPPWVLPPLPPTPTSEADGGRTPGAAPRAGSMKSPTEAPRPPLPPGRSTPVPRGSGERPAELCFVCGTALNGSYCPTCRMTWIE